MIYGQCTMSGWHTMLLKSSGWHKEIWINHHHHDIIDVIFHRDELQQMYYAIRMTCAPTLKSYSWDNTFQIVKTRSVPSVLPHHLPVVFHGVEHMFIIRTLRNREAPDYHLRYVKFPGRNPGPVCKLPPIPIALFNSLGYGRLQSKYSVSNSVK